MEQEIENNGTESQEEEIPLCLNCLQPVSPLAHLCPNCGRAVGQYTPLLPYESLWWRADVWGKIWNQLFSKDVSLVGKFFRLFMIIWNVPIMLIGIIPKLWYLKDSRNKDNTDRYESPESLD